MRINSFVKILVLLLLPIFGIGQISTNTNFEFLGNLPPDTRDTLTTLGDTSNVVWIYPGLLSYVVDQDQFWYNNGSYWKLFESGGLNNFYASGDTLYALSPDSLFAVYLGNYLDNDTIYQTLSFSNDTLYLTNGGSVFLPYVDSLLLADTTGVLRSLIDLAGSQYIDTLQLQGDTMLQVSIFGDNQPLKELNLSALSGDNLGNHTMTQNLQTNGNWISGDGGNEGIYVDASGKVGVGTLTPSYILDINSTDAVRLPVGTTAQNPTGADGLLRYNSDLTSFSGYYNAQWNRLVDYDFLTTTTQARTDLNWTGLTQYTYYTVDASGNLVNGLIIVDPVNNNQNFGQFSGNNNVSYSNTLGYIAGYNNTGNYQNAFGREAGRYNTGSSQNALGWNAGQYNTGQSQNAFGRYAARYNTGDYQNAFGDLAGSNNTGDYQNAFGRQAGAYNNNLYQNAFGWTAGYANEGINQNAFGTFAGGYNTGRDQNGFGANAGRYSNSDYMQGFGSGVDATGSETTITPTGYDYVNNRVAGNFSGLPINRKLNFRENGAGTWRRLTVMSADSAQLDYDIVSPSTFDITFPALLTDVIGIGRNIELEKSNTFVISSPAGMSMGIEVVSPTARLHLPAGTATANTSPLKFTSGTNLTTPEDGAMEWDGTNLYITQTTGPTRKTIAYTDDITAETNDLSSVVTWDTIPDLYVQSSSVVQHEGDLTIDNIPLNRIPYGTGTALTSESGFTYDGSNLYVDYNDADSYTWLRTAGLGSRTLYLSDQSSTTDKYIRVSNDDGIYYSQQFLDSSLLAKELILDYRLKLVYNAGGEYHGADFFDFANGSSSLWSYKSSANGGSTTTLNLRTHTNAQTTDDIADASVLFLQTGRWGTTETESIFNETEWETRNHPNANETLGSILFGTRVDEGFNVVDYVGAAIYAETPGDWSGSSTPAYISFATTPTGSASSPTRIMTLNATQDVVLNSYWSGNKIGTSTKYLMAIDTLDGRLFKLPIDSIGSGVYLTSEINDLTSAVTWANVPDANITQSSVTQHQAALSITESQISDLAHTPNQTIDTLSYDNTTGILSASLSNDVVAASTVDLDRYYTPGKIPYSDGFGFLTTGNVNYNSTPTYTNGLIDINHTSSWTAALSIDMDGDTTMNNNFSIVPRSSGGQELNFYTNGQSNASTTNIITHVMNGDPLPGFLNSQLSHMGFFVVRNTGNETDGIINDTVSSVTNKPAFVFFNGNGSDGNFIPEVLGIGVGNTGTTGGPNIVIYHRDSTVDNSASFPPHNFLYTNSTGVVMSAPGTKFPVTNPLGGTNQLQAALDSLNANLGGGGATQLSDLIDVNTSTPTNRNVLVADGVDWESRALVEADISDLSHTGNGIFDIANDEATVPAGLNARLGGDFSISNSLGNVFFITKGASQSVGIGSASTSAGYNLSVSEIISSTSGTVGDIAIGSSIAPATTSSLTYNGIVASPVISGTSNKTGDITAAVFYPYNSGSGTISNLYGVKITPITLAGTITNLRSLAIAPNRIVGGAVTNVTNVELGLNGGSYTNYYGVRVLNTSAATTAKAIALELSAGANKHNLYVSGTADNYFEGDVGIGVSSPDYKLDVVGTLGVTGTVRFEGYGQGNKEVGDLALTNSGYLATYATDGTLMEIGLTNPYGGESSITGVLDSLYANQNGTASYAEMYVNLIDPDTISFAGISDSLITETTAGELANFTHSNGRLTYTGSATIKVAVRVSASFTYDNIGTLGLLVYKNGTYQEKSRAEHNILSGEANSARIRPISTNCILTLSQNDYVEVGWETNTAGSTVLTTEDLNVIVTKL